ncbi:hypothetical protein STAFG_2736 [Streptomyces afghaniensis 772]|uniref:Uncharacterized protein n=1 Tax=Streptomyces afghaniensis 772 TaxID=1283301 RepID=S4MU81_9ACTN|nr:hypothetical protein STAFG_2736 [Streptomyces afghaniensis 772]
MVGGRVVAGLVGGGDAEAGAVVEGAVVQAGGAALGGLDHAGDGGGAVGGEDGLAGLDLYLEADPAGLQAVCLLEGVQQPRHGGDLLGIGHLRQGEHQPAGQAAGLHQAGEEDVERADAPGRTGASMHFMRMPMVGGRGAVLVRLGDESGRRGRRPRPPRRPGGCRSRPRSRRAGPRSARVQLGAHASVDGLGEFVGQAEDGGEGRGVRGVFVEGGQGPVAPGADGVGGEDVAGDVDGVDGLAGAGVSGVAALQLGVDGREGGADLLADGAREARRHLLLLALTHPETLLFSALRNQ